MTTSSVGRRHTITDLRQTIGWKSFFFFSLQLNIYLLRPAHNGQCYGDPPLSVSVMTTHTSSPIPIKTKNKKISTASSLNSCLRNQNPNPHNSSNSTEKSGNDLNVDSDNRDDDNSERTPPRSNTTCWVRSEKIRSSITRTKDQSHMRKT